MLLWKKILLRSKLWKANSSLPWYLVCDVDGVLTDGKFHYSSKGKVLKVFGSHDADFVKSSSFFSQIVFVSADWRGFDISRKRVEDMGQTLLQLTPDERKDFILEIKSHANVVFIGDSASDLPALKAATISAAPRNAFPIVRRSVMLPLKLRGGEGALAELIAFFDSLNYRQKNVL